MSGNGKTTRCTAKVEYNGQTEKSTKVNIRMTRNTGLELSAGQMAGNMKASGRKANSTEGVSIICLIKVRK